MVKAVRGGELLIILLDSPLTLTDRLLFIIVIGSLKNKVLIVNNTRYFILVGTYNLCYSSPLGLNRFY